MRRVHCKKDNFTQRFNLQGHARVQILTYKDVSVYNASLNFHMFYDNRRVSTQISRLCHVHAQVHTRDKILCSDWSPPLLIEELACRHLGQDKLLFKNAALYVKSYVETFFLVKVMGKLHIDMSS